jgi:hypothetical protein
MVLMVLRQKFWEGSAMASAGGGKTKANLWTKFFSGNSKPDAADPWIKDAVKQTQDDSLTGDGESAVLAESLATEQLVEETEALSETEAAAAEAERLKAAKEQEIKQAEKDMLFLSERSAQMQKAAVAALEALAAAEQAAAAAENEAEAAVAAEQALRAQTEDELSHIREVNEDARATARQNADKLGDGLARKKEEAAAALLEAEQAAVALKEEKSRLNSLIKEKEQQIKQALATADQARNAADKQEKNTEAQFAGLDAELSTYLQEYDKAVRELSETEIKRQKYGVQLREIQETSKQSQANLTKELNSSIASFEEKITAATAKRERLTADLATRRADTERAAEEVKSTAAAVAAALKDLKRLHADKDALVSAADKEKAAINAKVDEARRDVTDKKEAYAQAQKQVERSTSAAVKANALADAACEKAYQAALEEEDAATATETAQKLKNEATLARSNTDETSSQLLSKAESVLLNTTQQALRLHEEKGIFKRAAEQEAAELRAAAELAAAEAKRDSEAADRLVSAWLAAEESLVKSTVEAEAVIRKLEAENAAQLTDFEQKISAAEKHCGKCHEAASRATRQNERLSSALQDCETEHTAVIQALAELMESYDQEKIRIELALADKASTTANSIAYYQEEIARLEAQFEPLTQARDQKRQILDRKVEQFNADKEHLMQLNMEKRVEVAALEKEAVNLQAETEKLLEEIRAQVEEVRLFREARRTTADNINAQAEKITAAYNIALQEVERIRKAGEDSVAQAEQAALLALAPKAAAVKSASDQVSQKLAELREIRGQAADAVKSTVEVSLSRLDALNQVSIGKAEKELLHIVAEITAVSSELASCQSLTEAAAETAAAATKEAAALRGEEVEIGANADRKYREVERAKNAELAALDKKLARLSAAQADSSVAFAAAQADLEQAQAGFIAAEQHFSACRSEQETLARRTEELLAPFVQEFQEAMAQEAGDLPELQQQVEASQQRLIAAQTAYAEAENLWQQQLAVVAELAAQEEKLRAECADTITSLQAEKEAAQAAVEKNLNSLRTKMAKRQQALAEAQEQVEQVAENRRNLEEYFQSLQDEENAEHNAAAGELKKIQDKLRALRDDMGGKEQKFHATEQTLLNSSALLREAEKRVEEARELLAKTESELNAAEYTRKTHFTLADQASQSYQAVDKDTAAILRQASEDLLLEANNAASLAKEKKAAYEAAAENLRLCERNLASMRKAIKEAPLLSEKDQDAWNKAVRAYKKYEKEAAKLAAAVEAGLAAFLDERAAVKKEAETTLARCIRDSESAANKAQACLGRVEEATAEIARNQAAIADAEQHRQEAAARAAAATEELVAGLSQEKQGAAAIADSLKQQLDLRGSEKETALAEFNQLEASFNERDAAYSQACDKLRMNFEQEKRKVERPWEKAKDAEIKAEKARAKAAERVVEAENALAKTEKDCQNKTAALDAAQQSRLQLVESRESLLQGIEEEKLRVLGFKTIARIGADERATQKTAVLAERQAALNAAAKKLGELQATHKQGEKSLKQIREDSVKSLVSARENTIFLQSRELS